MINFARELVDYKIISIQPKEVKLESIKTPIYCDVKALQSNPQLRQFVVNSLIEKIKSYRTMPDGIAGVISGVIPFSTLVADRLNLPHYSIGISKKNIYGTEDIIEGRIKKDKNILLLDDIVVTGKKSANAVKILRSRDVKVDKMLCVVNYGTNYANNNFKQINCEIDCLTSIEKIIFEHVASYQPAKKAMQKLEGFINKHIPHGDKLIYFLSGFKL